ncbi:PepSY domain-containing protein [Planococcus lenghuensis]|uniref:PepSY domain-containing protein n=1 Tax=Planococcus lenghuensis TaxID=2213202 RepID=A0A1Q2KZ35_9BACL|nr:PepSY domain-containing protein [Planococcus lenghuensis]AQQ53465.1 hypothetical protein B0X71_10525 [Planococcus lenghuensis]
MQKNKKLAIAGAASALVLTGAVFTAQDSRAAEDLAVTFEEAKELALTEVPGEVVEEETEEENGTTEYEFDIIAADDNIEYEVEVNQAGELLVEPEDEENETGAEEDDDE